MECKLSELVKLGHDQAAELKSSCGAVDVRDVAQLISDLATQLDVAAVALQEMARKRDAEHGDVLAWEKAMFKACGEDGPKSVADKFADLEAKCAALAAENAGLREYRPQPSGAAMMEALDAFYEYHEDVPEQGMMAAFEILCCKRPETPATDSFLAEVRASAVDEVCLKISNAIVNCYQDEQVGLDSAATICGDFAAQLRKGASA